MSVFHVDSGMVGSAAASTATSADTIRTEVSQMMSLLYALQDSWSGAASASFQELIAQWQATQIQVEESLGAIAAMLSQAASTYADAEAASAALFVGR